MRLSIVVPFSLSTATGSSPCHHHSLPLFRPRCHSLQYTADFLFALLLAIPAVCLTTTTFGLDWFVSPWTCFIVAFASTRTPRVSEYEFVEFSLIYIRSFCLLHLNFNELKACVCVCSNSPFHFGSLCRSLPTATFHGTYFIAKILQRNYHTLCKWCDDDVVAAAVAFWRRLVPVIVRFAFTECVWRMLLVQAAPSVSVRCFSP